MRRLMSLFKDREASGAGSAAADPREPWSPDGEPKPAVTPTAEADKPGAPAPRAEPADLISIEGHPLQEAMIAALKSVYDPEIPVDIYELGLIYDVQLSPENDVFVKMTLTAPGCPVAGQMPGMVRAAIEEHVPEARAVDVEIVWDPPWRPDMMSEGARLETGMF